MYIHVFSGANRAEQADRFSFKNKAALYEGLNLRLTYEHMTGTIRAEAQPGECPF